MLWGEQGKGRARSTCEVVIMRCGALRVCVIESHGDFVPWGREWPLLSAGPVTPRLVCLGHL